MQNSKLQIKKFKLKTEKDKSFRFCIIVLSFTFYVLTFIGCVTIPPVMPPKPEGIPGIYHRVEKGQTLWRISKMYNLGLDELIKINRISDVTNIEVGQLIFIPSHEKPQILSDNYSAEDFIWPVKGKVIATFGRISNNMINKGINIQPHKAQDVVAARSGRVVFYSQDFDGFGKTIIIDHDDGFSTVYAGNSEVFIKAGDRVRKGAIIAKISSVDRDKNVYLHFEIRKGYMPQNPYFYLPR